MLLRKTKRSCIGSCIEASIGDFPAAVPYASLKVLPSVFASKSYCFISWRVVGVGSNTRSFANLSA